MSKTVESYHMALANEIHRWNGFEKALRTEDRQALEELMDACRNSALAGKLLSFAGYTPKKYVTLSRASIKQTLFNGIGKSSDEISRIMCKNCVSVNGKLYNWVFPLKDDTVVQNAAASSSLSSSPALVVEKRTTKKE